MRTRYRAVFVFGLLLVATASATCFQPSRHSNALEPRALEPRAFSVAADEKVELVEPDMHEFMEYICQPTFRRLQASMANAPADNAGWRGVKSDALILAESGNLLLSHVPESDVETWVELSVAVRTTGGELYRAAKAKDFPAARGHYEAMVKKCNACHDHFAEGEHQLTP